jgi:hypothetical protein
MTDKKFNLLYTTTFVAITYLIVANSVNIAKFATTNGATFALVIVLGIIYTYSILLFFFTLWNIFEKKTQ